MMSRDIIDEGPLLVNTFWGGKDRKECVQFTMSWKSQGADGCYIQMTREEARRFLLLAYNRLSSQILDDEENPPWWQK